ncbi:MAG TPA: YsnF/AvaK domain-containing protein [Allosphingosinicella sp.]|nr:YsnF/AvaK domain-containing protein [Allosphingosinicella sp.]
MPSTVIAHFDDEAEADRILSAVAAKVPLQDSAVLAPGLPGTLTLDSLDLGPEERSACEAQLKRGGFLMVAQAAGPGEAEAIVRTLDEIAPQIIVAALQSPERPSGPAPAAEERVPVAEQAPTKVAEERIPIVEEELAIGKREVRRGGARVHSYPVDVPVRQQVELLEEEASVTRRPVNRRLTEEEVVEGGLLRDRVIEIAEMREEAVVSKEAFVREELVVTKNVKPRVEQIHDTVRRTEVETEALQPEGLERK